MFLKRTTAILLLLTLVSSSQTSSVGLALRFGPPAVGRGGPNPVGLPPSLVDAQISVFSRSGFEGNFSVTGLFVGQRFQNSWGGYVTLGGGLPISANGGGLGVYSAFGIDLNCDKFCFTAEYIRGIGLANEGITQPYGIRIGGLLWLD